MFIYRYTYTYNNIFSKLVCIKNIINFTLSTLSYVFDLKKTYTAASSHHQKRKEFAA